MESLRIENLRCIKDSGDIPIKALNIFVGQNSSGKSTFLRTFPLFRQSLERRIRGPILWYGQYVDFGSFEEAIHEGDEREIRFTYTTKVPVEEHSLFQMFLFIDSYYPKDYPNRTAIDVKVGFSITEQKESVLTFINGITLELLDYVCKITFNENLEVCSLLVNGKDYLKSENKKVRGYYRNEFFPALIVDQDGKAGKSDYFQREGELGQPLINYVRKLNYKTTKPQTIYDIISQFSFDSKINFLHELKEDSKRRNLSRWTNSTNDWTTDSEEFNELYNLYFLYQLNNIMEYLDSDFCNTMIDVHYIAPVRAQAERYYRVQNLSVLDVDFQGKNLPMFIEALSTKEIEDFQTWVKDNFNFIPGVTSEKGHLSLVIETLDGKSFNIADKGFGYSQILPIITQLWSLIHQKAEFQDFLHPLFKRRKNSIDRLLIIEQPELHLHPALQGLLVDSMIIALRDAEQKGIRLRILIETHSETIVNCIGHLIADKQLDHDDVSVAIFGQECETHKITLGSYDKDGYLTKWPAGFFSAKRR